MKTIKEFLLPFKRQGTFSLWAFLVFGVGLAMMAIGVCELAIYYGGQPSLISSWALAVLGLGFYVFSGFGFKFPKKEVKRKQKRH